MLITLFVVMIISIIANGFLVLKLKRDNDNTIFKEILDKVSTNELNYVDSSAINIINVLKKYYKIDYCTILIREKDELEVIASDVNSVYFSDLEKHCISLQLRAKAKAIIQSTENDYLHYASADTRGIKYSYFLTLGRLGCIFIENKEQYAGNNFELDIFKTIMKNIGIILQNCIYQDKIAKLAMKDNLTGMYNRNYMQKHIDMLKQKKEEFCIAIMDIDHFKTVNDTYGHDCGDVVLKEVSKFVKNRLSIKDEIYRWGGEEFIMIFINQELEHVEDKLNKIRKELSTYEIKHNSITLNVTSSFGVAKFDVESTIESEIKKADKCLYYSKQNGRNRVTINK